MLLAYTKEEGGEWFPLEMDLPENAIVAELLSFHHLCNEDVKGTPYRTCLNNVHVQSVRFPDGRIWDSILSDFDTPENVASYMAKERLACHF